MHHVTAAAAAAAAVTLLLTQAAQQPRKKQHIGKPGDMRMADLARQLNLSPSEESRGVISRFCS
jgi:hypothetical protein